MYWHRPIPYSFSFFILFLMKVSGKHFPFSLSFSLFFALKKNKKNKNNPNLRGGRPPPSPPLATPLPSLLRATVALSFQIEICNLDRTKSSFLATILFLKNSPRIELQALITPWMIRFWCSLSISCLWSICFLHVLLSFFIMYTTCIYSNSRLAICTSGNP